MITIPRTPAIFRAAGVAVKWSAVSAIALCCVLRGNAATFTIAIGSDGSFQPPSQKVFDGDTVIWKLANPASDAIVRLSAQTVPLLQSRGNPALDLSCSDYRAYDAGDPNEFTGPMPRAASGVFTLSPDGPGFVEYSGPLCATKCTNKIAEVRNNLGIKCLCAASNNIAYATMDSTWSDPAITGVFIRLRWNEVHLGPGRFDWAVLDREISKAVAQGKLYSIGIKAGREGTPAWIETEAKPLVRRYRFVDHGGTDGEDAATSNGDRCGKEMFLGSPADAAFRTQYFAMLSALAARIRAKSAWYRALAYVKPSGVNLFSHENRAPKNCDSGCLCNPEVWAKQAGYKPSELQAFYREQLALFKREFPGKDIAYALIQAGFPLVGEFGEFEGQSPPPLQINKSGKPCAALAKGQIPWGTQQTECILEESARDHPGHFVVQHNGLGPACGDRDGNGKDDCLPQNLVVQAGKEGRMIGFQTNNASKVGNNTQLDGALQNGYCNSEATFMEIYEERAWEARNRGGALDATRSQLCDLSSMKARTLAAWSNQLLSRRNLRGRTLALPDFRSNEHRHTFKRTVATGHQTFRYAHGSRCTQSGATKPATITVVPPFATDAATQGSTATSGLEEIPPAGKNLTSRQTTMSQDANIALRGLTLREAPGRACQLSLWYANLRGQPARAVTLQNIAAASGAANCSGGEPDKTALFESESQYVHGLRVCVGGNYDVRGVEIFGAKVDDNAKVITTGQPSQRMTLSGCKTWSRVVACGPQKVAVGVTTFFDTSRGYIGMALQCKGIISLD